MECQLSLSLPLGNKMLEKLGKNQHLYQILDSWSCDQTKMHITGDSGHLELLSLSTPRILKEEAEDASWGK